jgi:hypothetical protein
MNNPLFRYSLILKTKPTRYTNICSLAHCFMMLICQASGRMNHIKNRAEIKIDVGSVTLQSEAML